MRVGLQILSDLRPPLRVLREAKQSYCDLTLILLIALRLLGGETGSRAWNEAEVGILWVTYLS